MPYISTTPAKLRNPCTNEQNCTSPFSYKNVLSLTDKGEVFNELVGKQRISGNLVSPEGGFDAIMQVAVCGVSAFILYRDIICVEFKCDFSVRKYYLNFYTILINPLNSLPTASGLKKKHSQSGF